MAALNSPNVEPTPQESAPIPAEPIPKPGPLAQASQVETTVRLNVALLDSLMTVVGEPVLGRTQLNEAIRDAEFTRQVADQSPKLGKQAGYRLHPGEGNGFLQFGNHQTHAVGTGTDPLLVAVANGFVELIPAQHQFAGQCHQRIEKSHIQANRGL